MAKRRPSLLNAFKAADIDRPENKPVPAPAPLRPPPKRVEVRADEAIPVRPAAPLPPQRPPPRRAGTHADPPAPLPPLSRGRLLMLSVVGAAILLTVILVLKFTNTSENVSAADPSAARQPEERASRSETAPARPVEAAPSTAATHPALDMTVGHTDDDRAFLDPKNRFTVRLAQYANDANGVRLAREAYKYLRGEGVPIVQPIQSGNGDHIYLCADARAKKDDLVGLCEYIKRLRGPGGQKTPFHDAYIDNIEHLLKR
ncbi:MAG: hypothetical protein JNL28_13055 [Planctomycetes bacterium]|nr:hypothetical protein [Planctomycetota bacterium]